MAITKTPTAVNDGGSGGSKWEELADWSRWEAEQRWAEAMEELRRRQQAEEADRQRRLAEEAARAEEARRAQEEAQRAQEEAQRRQAEERMAQQRAEEQAAAQRDAEQRAWQERQQQQTSQNIPGVNSAFEESEQQGPREETPNTPAPEPESTTPTTPQTPAPTTQSEPVQEQQEEEQTATQPKPQTQIPYVPQATTVQTPFDQLFADAQNPNDLYEIWRRMQEQEEAEQQAVEEATANEWTPPIEETGTPAGFTSGIVPQYTPQENYSDRLADWQNRTYPAYTGDENTMYGGRNVGLPQFMPEQPYTGISDVDAFLNTPLEEDPFAGIVQRPEYLNPFEYPEQRRRAEERIFGEGGQRDQDFAEFMPKEETGLYGDWRDNLGWGEERVNLGNGLGQFGTPAGFTDRIIPKYEPNNFYDTTADVINDVADYLDPNATNRNMVENLLDALPPIDYSKPDAEQEAIDRYNRMADLARQIEADDDVTPKPRVTGEQVKDFVDTVASGAADFGKNLLGTVLLPGMLAGKGIESAAGKVSDVAKEIGNLDAVQMEAVNLGYEPGSKEFIDYVNSHREQPKKPEAESPKSPTVSAPDIDQSDVFNMVDNGVPVDWATKILEQPEKYGWNYETGRPIYKGPQAESHLSWADAIGNERLMDDLMLMNAPGVDEKGNFNTAAQALFLGADTAEPYADFYTEGTRNYPELRANVDPETGKITYTWEQPTGKNNYGLTAEQKLHLFDRGGAFADKNSGVSINDLFADIMAKNPEYAMGSPLGDSVKLTEDQLRQKYSEFLESNPLIGLMVEMGMISDVDAMDNFFKNIELTSGKGSGSGYGSGYRGYGSYGGGGYYGGGYRGYTYNRRKPNVSAPNPSYKISGGRNNGYLPNGSQTAQAQRVNKTPVIAKQQEQRVNNIMKNWSF